MGSDQAAVWVTVRGHRQETIAGEAIDDVPLVWWAFDVLRINDGQVAERWSQGDSLSLTDAAVLNLPQAMQVSRFVLPAQTSLPPMSVSHSALLVVEEGTIALRTIGDVTLDPGHDLWVEPVFLDEIQTAGQHRVLAPGLSHSIHNEGVARAVVIILPTDPMSLLPDPERDVTSSRDSSTSSTAPMLIKAAAVAPGSIAVTGRGFTPAGLVSIILYDVWGGTLHDAGWVTASSPDAVFDPAGGVIAVDVHHPYGAVSMVRAYDMVTATWSNWLSVDTDTSPTAQNGMDSTTVLERIGREKTPVTSR